jgi:CBS domain-containing protein
MEVYEFMSTKMDLIDANQSVYDAVEMMVDRRIRFLVVKKPGKSEAIEGVLTARDVVFRVLAQGVDPKHVMVADVASKPIVCIEQEMTIEDAATLMRKSNIARLFVCDGEKVRGVLNLLDVMAAELVMRARGNHDT